MKNDRIVVGDGYVWKQDPNRRLLVMAYNPLIDQNGHFQTTPEGVVVIENAGGVEVGSTGVIVGDPIDVYRSYLHASEGKAYSIGGNEKVQLVPVLLDTYQKIGWFPIDHTRIFGTSVG